MQARSWRSTASTAGEPRYKRIRANREWQGLADDDEWQIKDPSQAYDKRRLRELDFWFGATTPTAAGLDRREA